MLDAIMRSYEPRVPEIAWYRVYVRKPVPTRAGSGEAGSMPR